MLHNAYCEPWHACSRCMCHNVGPLRFDTNCMRCARNAYKIACIILVRHALLPVKWHVVVNLQDELFVRHCRTSMSCM